MIIEWLFKKFEDEEEGNKVLIFGLFAGLSAGFAGLILGLSYGLLTGLLVGLLVGLLTGLVGGLLTGLILGLSTGLLTGLGFLIIFLPFLGLASLITHYPNFLPLWLFFLIGFILVELFFWFDKQKPKKKQSKVWFTCMKKGEAILEATAVLGVLNLIRVGINKLIIWKVPLEEILKWTGYIGLGLSVLAVIAGIILIYIKLNSLKYGGKSK